jgi:uncharacterized protein (TIGR02145 family)
MNLNSQTSKLVFVLFVSGSVLMAYNMTKTVAKLSIYPPLNHHPQRIDTATIEICDQVWIIHNLNVATYRNGDSIPQVRDPKAWLNLRTGAWCWYNNDSASYATTYGKLYNWYAVHDPRGLAPRGWHVPSHKEWCDLDTCIGLDSLGFRMRGRGWPVPASTADNSSGFNGLPGGMRSDGGTFYLLGLGAVFWVSDVGSTSETWCYRMVQYVNDEKKHLMGTGWGYMSKTEGYSVRCVRDTMSNR